MARGLLDAIDLGLRAAWAREVIAMTIRNTAGAKLPRLMVADTNC